MLATPPGGKKRKVGNQMTRDTQTLCGEHGEQGGEGLARAAAKKQSSAQPDNQNGRGRWVAAAAAAAAAKFSTDDGDGEKNAVDGSPGELRRPTLASLIAAMAIEPLCIDSRARCVDGALGAVYPMSEYERVHEALQGILACFRQASLEPIPPLTLEALRAAGSDSGNLRPLDHDHDGAHRARDGLGQSQNGVGEDKQVRAEEGEQEQEQELEEWEGYAARLPQHLRACLLPYQREGVRFVLARRGRALIADEMGLGKTLQALASACCLHAFPLLIVCPATLRLVWASECEKWLPRQAAVGRMHVVFGQGDLLARSSSSSNNNSTNASESCCAARAGIVITSYHMLRGILSNFLQVSILSNV